MAYTKVFERPYSGGWVDYPSETTQITAAALNEYDETFQHVEDYLEDNPIADANATITNDYWNAATTYAVGDVVIYLNGLYRCIVANTGQTPTDTTYWESISLADISKKIYTTGERVIGYWTDGRPIYEKVMVLETPLQCPTNVWTYVPNSGLGSGVSPLIVDTRVIDGNGTLFGYVGCNYNGGLFGILNIRTNNNINISRLILQYTKSTD